MLATSVEKHQLGEILSVIRSTSYGFERLAESFAMSHEDFASTEGKKILDSAQACLHKWGHNYGFFIAAGLYQRSKRMSATERVSFYDALYPSWDRHPKTDGLAPLTSILALVGVRAEKDLIVLFEEGADALLGPANAPQIGTKPVTVHKPGLSR